MFFRLFSPGGYSGKDGSSETVQETSGPVQRPSGGRERTGTDTQSSGELMSEDQYDLFLERFFLTLYVGQAYTELWHSLASGRVQ